MTTESKPMSEAVQYAESCDNESGSFLSRDLIKIRVKAFIAGYEACAKSKDAQIAELVEDMEFLNKLIGKCAFSDQDKWGSQMNTVYGVTKRVLAKHRSKS